MAVVGAGAVGQAIGGALVTAGLADELLVASRTREQAAALADDLDDMRAALSSPTRPRPAAVEELQHCEAIVVAVRARFVNDRSSDVRMGGARANAPAVRQLAAELRGYPGTVLMVTNPVDLLTRLLAEESGAARVFGIGSNLDSARYRLTVARLLDVPVDRVRGHVIGEHGDAAVVCASSTTVNGDRAVVPLDAVRAELAGRPARINEAVGRTRYGPAGAVVATLRLALGAEDGTTELSVLRGSDCFGIPLSFTGGQPLPSVPPLDPSEADGLQAARTKLHAAYAAVLGIPTHPSGGARDDSRSTP
ncbi:lactate/malate family dehydrogenase [Streptomyces sp. Tu 6176]|uniref:lactate/malate family dehydrogenase n=1 Tax=Streptomyces sp. Tu 6176 TaxID=1470557 RepID=UPI001F267C08|nr:NAD(P)-binding domain-containing protein [Streptomyces sp. Tu 6176]